MRKLMDGIARFKKDVFPKQAKLFRELANSQAPEVLFITCSDSRIDPNLITQTEPGDLFICRNAGNIVPPHALHTGGMTASIEYALGVLGVEHIVLCGHTDCGAMKGALNRDALTHLPHVCEWLSHSEAAVLTVHEKYGALSPEETLQKLIQENVLVQMANLRTHPYVAAYLAAGKIKLHGWVYDIASGSFVAYNEASGKFEPLLMEKERKAIHPKRAV